MAIGTVRVVAHLTAKPDKINETRAALMALIDPTRAEEGCIVYELMQNNVEPTDFTFVEEWTSDATLNAHLHSDHIRTLQSRADDILAVAPDVRRYTFLG